MISFCIPFSNDEYFNERKQIVIFALNDLILKLTKFRIEAQIILVDFGGKRETIDTNLLRLGNLTKKIQIKYIKAKEKNSNKFYYGDALKVAINNSDSENILIKASDTIFNNQIYYFLKEKKFLNDFFYCVLRKDFKHVFQNIEKNFNSSSYYINHNTDYLMRKINLHTNAVGDFILVKKKYIKKIKFFQKYGIHNDTFIVGCLKFMGLKQIMIKDGFVLKLLHKRTFKNRHKLKEISNNFKFIENTLLNNFKYKYLLIELLRGIFDYPKYISNPNYESLGRLKLKILLRFLRINLYPKERDNPKNNIIILNKIIK